MLYAMSRNSFLSTLVVEQVGLYGILILNADDADGLEHGQILFLIQCLK